MRLALLTAFLVCSCGYDAVSAVGVDASKKGQTIQVPTTYQTVRQSTVIIEIVSPRVIGEWVSVELDENTTNQFIDLDNASCDIYYQIACRVQGGSW